MADADTIVVLDGLQFQKETTADIYTQDHATNEAVKTFQIYVPKAYMAARVIINGAYDPDGGRMHARVKATMRTKGDEIVHKQVLEWTAVTPPAVQDSGTLRCDHAEHTILHIDIAQSSTTANTTGVELIVQGCKETSVDTSGNVTILDEWTDITRFVTLALGAATKSDFAAQEAAGQTTLSVTDPTTGNLDHVGKHIFIEDPVTIAQCEIAFITECGADA